MWYGFTTAWHVSRTACLKAGGGSFGQLERCSSECQSVAQTDQVERSTRPGWTGMFRWYVLLGQQGKKHVSGVAGLKPWSARAWRRRASARALLERASERCSDRPRQEQYEGNWTTWLQRCKAARPTESTATASRQPGLFCGACSGDSSARAGLVCVAH